MAYRDTSVHLITSLTRFQFSSWALQELLPLDFRARQQLYQHGVSVHIRAVLEHPIFYVLKIISSYLFSR